MFLYSDPRAVNFCSTAFQTVFLKLSLQIIADFLKRIEILIVAERPERGQEFHVTVEKVFIRVHLI